ncbi:MAG TPA: hypothetical protein VJ741_11460 [Solirubrobacteraceae bacterium]|nr:hypothetical protein [Solirubrobacteraceae bacterium]
MSRKLITAALTLASIALAAAVTGCGATKAISGAVDPVAQAATRTAQAPGYRMSVSTVATTAGTTVRGTMTGVIDTARHTGAFTTNETVAGHAVSIVERLSGTTIYMKLPNQSALDSLTGGKPWLKLDFSRALGAFGLGGLTTQSSNPAQFIDYLRAVGAKHTRVGTATIDGVQTTHYHVVINLDNYPKLFPADRRAAAARGVSTLENAIGSHTMPMDAWIDSQNLLRRMSFSFGECVQSQHLTLAMTMNLSDYGPQTVPAAPAASDAYDLTPLLVKTLKNYKPGTCGPAA